MDSNDEKEKLLRLALLTDAVSHVAEDGLEPQAVATAVEARYNVINDLINRLNEE